VRVLVTGAARAIGAATVRELAGRDHEVVATARQPDLLAELPAKYRLRLDVTDPESVAAALEQAGELDAVVNNAALTGEGPIESFPVDRLRAMFETNTIGPVRLVQGVLPAWRKRGSGVIVNLSSVEGHIGPPLEGAYAATKHAIEAISEALHIEAGHFGIRVVIIEPGYIAPGMKHTEDVRGPDSYDELRRQWDGNVAALAPAGRTPAEVVARAIADAIEQPATPLRVVVGDDAAMVLAARRRLGDDEFEAAMREMLHLSW
jgi:NAD(P)-dependent dehydrogenase (short-subunit alcohol dehydrogenase family)